jgi:hypothetical protein
MSVDNLLAGGLAVVAAVYLTKKNVQNMLVWLGLGYIVSYNYLTTSRFLSVVFGIVTVYVVTYFSTLEHFEEEKKLEKKDDVKDPEPTGKSTPHVDLGTTILHAYRNLTPEQIGGMKRDTKELMDLQKELMGTLAEMKPAIEQGAELLGTFSQFFGQNG